MVKTSQQRRSEYALRPQNNSIMQRAKPRPPRTKKLQTASQYDKNALKRPSTMTKYRYGWKLAWKLIDLLDLS